MKSDSTHMPEVLKKLKDLLFSAINNNEVKIYLFGSWARNTNKTSSDIDIAIWHPFSPGPEFFVQLRDLIEESTLPYRVDLIDLNHVDPVIKDKILQEGILWND